MRNSRTTVNPWQVQHDAEQAAQARRLEAETAKAQADVATAVAPPVHTPEAPPLATGSLGVPGLTDEMVETFLTRLLTEGGKLVREMFEHEYPSDWNVIADLVPDVAPPAVFCTVPLPMLTTPIREVAIPGTPDRQAVTDHYVINISTEVGYGTYKIGPTPIVIAARAWMAGYTEHAVLIDAAFSALDGNGNAFYSNTEPWYMDMLAIQAHPIIFPAPLPPFGGAMAGWHLREYTMVTFPTYFTIVTPPRVHVHVRLRRTEERV